MFKFKTIVGGDTKCIVLFFIVLSALLETDAKNQRNIEAICNTIRSQTAYSLREMNGFWYGIELLQHIARSDRPGVESCIKVDIKTSGNDHVYLTWREKNLAVTYTFYIENNTNRGMWTSLGNQDVSEKPYGYEYEQFAGKVFVLRASDNLVLTFCSATKVFTLVLSKNYTMNSTELNSIHTSLIRFGVPQIKDSKRYCKNGAYNVRPGNFPIIFIGFVAFKIYEMYS